MNSGPLPPHERTWRHPSEVAAEQRAQVLATPPDPGTRKLALSAGVIALGLLVVTLLGTILSLRVAPSVQMQASTSVIRVQRTIPSLPAERISLNQNESMSPAAVSAGGDTESIHATPIGDGSLALVTATALHAGQISAVVSLPDRTEQLADVLNSVRPEAHSEVVVMQLSYASAPMRVAKYRPSGQVDVIDADTGAHVIVSINALSTLSLDESTPIMNLDGELVGLWSRDTGDTPAMIPLDAAAVAELIDNTDVAAPSTKSDWSAFGEPSP